MGSKYASTCNNEDIYLQYFLTMKKTCKEKNLFFFQFNVFTRRVKALELEVLQVGNNLRTMEISEDQANQREDSTTTQITELGEKFQTTAERAEQFEAQAAALEQTQEELESKGYHFFGFVLLGPHKRF